MNKLNWIALLTLTRREVGRFFRIWTQTILPSPITMILYFVIFGSLIGGRIGQIQGYHYMEYIAPGLIMMGVINNAFGNVVSSFYGAKFQKSIEEMFVSPMSNGMIVSGFLMGGVLRGAVVGLIATIVASFFTKLHAYSFGIIFIAVLLTALLFSLCGLINAIFARKFDDVGIVPTFILAPLTYLGGVFYSVDMLSPFWQKIAYLNPILYMVNVFRYGMLGVSDVNVTYSLVIILGINVLLYVTALTLLQKGIGLKS